MASHNFFASQQALTIFYLNRSAHCDSLYKTDMLPEFKVSRKDLSHARILDAASRAIRRAGHSGVRVADVMKEAGLTHGGFYAHFRSRNDMVAAAISYAGA